MKYKFLALCVAFFVSINIVSATELPELTDREPIKVYVFWSDTCSACGSYIEILNEIEEFYLDYIEIVTIHLSDGTNSDLYQYAYDLIGGNGYIPYTVVGDSFIEGTLIDDVMELALVAYADDEYEDILESYIKINSDLSIEDLEYACNIKKINYWNAAEKDSTSDIIVLGILFIVIVSVCYLIFCPKKN